MDRKETLRLLLQTDEEIVRLREQVAQLEVIRDSHRVLCTAIMGLTRERSGGIGMGEGEDARWPLRKAIRSIEDEIEAEKRSEEKVRAAGLELDERMKARMEAFTDDGEPVPTAMDIFRSLKVRGVDEKVFVRSVGEDMAIRGTIEVKPGKPTEYNTINIDEANRALAPTGIQIGLSETEVSYNTESDPRLMGVTPDKAAIDAALGHDMPIAPEPEIEHIGTVAVSDAATALQVDEALGNAKPHMKPMTETADE